jgi:hypothetical protein
MMELNVESIRRIDELFDSIENHSFDHQNDRDGSSRLTRSLISLRDDDMIASVNVAKIQIRFLAVLKNADVVRSLECMSALEGATEKVTPSLKHDALQELRAAAEDAIGFVEDIPSVQYHLAEIFRKCGGEQTPAFLKKLSGLKSQFPVKWLTLAIKYGYQNLDSSLVNELKSIQKNNTSNWNWKYYKLLRPLLLEHFNQHFTRGIDRELAMVMSPEDRNAFSKWQKVKFGTQPDHASAAGLEGLKNGVQSLVTVRNTPNARARLTKSAT